MSEYDKPIEEQELPQRSDDKPEDRDRRFVWEPGDIVFNDKKEEPDA